MVINLLRTQLYVEVNTSALQLVISLYNILSSNSDITKYLISSLSLCK